MMTGKPRIKWANITSIIQPVWSGTVTILSSGRLYARYRKYIAPVMTAGQTDSSNWV